MTYKNVFKQTADNKWLGIRTVDFKQLQWWCKFSIFNMVKVFKVKEVGLKISIHVVAQIEHKGVMKIFEWLKIHVILQYSEIDEI